MHCSSMIRSVFFVLFSSLPLVLVGCIFAEQENQQMWDETTEGVGYSLQTRRSSPAEIVSAQNRREQWKERRVLVVSVRGNVEGEVKKIFSDDTLTSEEKAEKTRAVLTAYNATAEPEVSDTRLKGELHNVLHDFTGGSFRSWKMSVEVRGVDGFAYSVDIPPASWDATNRTIMSGVAVVVLPKKGQYTFYPTATWGGGKSKKGRTRHFFADHNRWSYSIGN